MAIDDEPEMTAPRKASREQRRKIPAPVTEGRLKNIALFYLSRYASSSDNLRRVLGRRVQRAALHHDTDIAAAQESIDRLISKLESNGLLDDRAYAEARARSLHRAGASRRRIAAQLAQKGVSSDVVSQSITTLDEHRQSDRDLDYVAAIRFARRRRLGPFGDPSRRTARRDRDLAAMARTGFSLAIARKVIDAEDIEGLEQVMFDEDGKL